VAHRRDSRSLLIDIAEINAAFGEFADHDFAQPTESVGVFGGEQDLVLIMFDRSGAAFEIEPGGEFLARLVLGVVDLLFVDF
jgi:hypothetical protein